jgi:transducin (beta)-like 1
MAQHRGPIFSLKWNMKGDLVLSGSADTTTVVWDPENGEMKQQFELHTCEYPLSCLLYNLKHILTTL